MANVFSTATLGLRLDTTTFNNAIKASGLTTQQAFASMSASAEQFKQKWDDATAGIKDTRRIISGILISQGFYGLMNGFIEGASAALSFSQNMETAAISTEYFVQGADKAAQSLAYLREMNTFAARTPFSTEAAMELSKYIQAVGISMNVSKSVLQTITDAAAATGATEETMQRIVFALGQMKTKGRIANEEIRQLANANVPIYEILQEELGLTGEQISNIGYYWVDADKAIVAILDGLEKRYAGAADRIADTMTGMVDTIVDDAKIIAYEAGDGIYNTLEGIIRNVRDKLDEYRDIATEFGSMGLFNEVLLEIDPTGEFGTQLLTLVGNARQLISALSDLVHTSQPLINLFGNGLYGAFGTVMVGATGLVRTVDELEQLLSKLGITSGQTGRLLGELFVMYQAGKWAFTLGQGALYAGQSLLQLGKSTITSLIPSMAAGSQSVMGLVGSLMLLAGAAAAVYSVLNSLSGYGGLDISSGSILPDDYQSEFDRYMAEMKEYNDAIAKYQEQFNEPYSAIGEGTDEAIESYDDLKKASKAAANAVQHDWVAAFDEVYQVPTFNDGSGGGGSDTPELPELPDLGKLIGEITFSFPGIPDELLEKPEFDWDQVFENSFFDNDVFNGGWWKTMLPMAITSGLIGMATAFAPKGPKDVPTRPISTQGATLSAKELNKMLAEFAEEVKTLPNAIHEAKALLANGDPALPGTSPAHGVEGRSLLALADKLDGITLSLDKREKLMLEAGVSARELPSAKDRAAYVLDTQKMQEALESSKRELAIIRKDVETAVARGGSPTAALLKQLNNAEVTVTNLTKQLDARSATPDGTLSAMRQQARITADAVRELGYETSIKQLKQAIEQGTTLTVGEIADANKQIKQYESELKALIKDSEVLPRYSQLTPSQFVTLFGTMGNEVAKSMDTVLNSLYRPNSDITTGVVNKETIALLESQLGEFSRMGKFAHDYYSDVLIGLSDSTGAAQRIYAALQDNEKGLKRAFDQLIRDKKVTKGESGAIERLKDIAKQVTGLTDEAEAARKTAQAQLEAFQVAQREAAAQAEAERLAQKEATRLARLTQQNEKFSVAGTAFDSKTQAALTEAFTEAIKVPTPEEFAKALKPIAEDVQKALNNTGGFQYDPSNPQKFVNVLNDEFVAKLDELFDVLVDVEPGTVELSSDVAAILEDIYTGIEGDSDGYAKQLLEYLTAPSTEAVAKVTSVDIPQLIHKTIRDTLGYATDPALLSATPELLHERKPWSIGIGDVAGMLEGSGPFSSASSTAARSLGMFSDDLLKQLAVRDAGFVTTVAGEITRQTSDLIKYVASAGLSASNLTVHSGGLIKDAGALLQVDAVAEGVIKGMSRTVPVQIVAVNGKVAERIASLASTPVGGLAELDAAKLFATNSEAGYELGALINAFGKTEQNKGLTSGIVVTLNRDLDIKDTRFAKEFAQRMGTLPREYKPLSTDTIMSWRSLQGLEDLSPKELVADYMKRVLLPTFGFFPDVLSGNLTGTEAQRLADTLSDVNKVAQQFRGSLVALKDAQSYYLVDYTKQQLNQLDISGAAAGTGRHIQLLQDVYNTLGDSAELERLLHSYAIMNANMGAMANAVLEVDFTAPIRQYTFLRQNANKWASDLLKTNVKFSSSKAVTSEFIAAVDGVVLDYFNALEEATKSGTTSALDNARIRLRDIANSTFSYFEFGDDGVLAKRALKALSDNLQHIEPLSLTVKSYVDVLADINRAIVADLPIDERLVAQFDGLTRNASNLINRFGLDANAWVQGYVQSLTNLSERLRAAEKGASLSTIFDGPVDALMRIANSTETADLASNLFKSITDGAYEQAIKNTVTGAFAGVVPTPIQQATQVAKAPVNATIIDLETFGLPQAIKGGTVYPEVFSGAMYNPLTGDMDRFYALPDDILSLIDKFGADSTVTKNAVDNYIAQIRDLSDDFRNIYGRPGMTEEVIAKGVSKTEAAKKLVSWTTSNTNGFTGYNATNLGRVGGAFDTNTINAFTGVEVSKYATDDVMQAVTNVLRRYTGSDTTMKLTELREMFGISDEMLQSIYGISEAASHTAQADVLVTNEIVKRINSGMLDAIADIGKSSGWKYTSESGEVISGIKDVLITAGKEYVQALPADNTEELFNDIVRAVSAAAEQFDDGVRETARFVENVGDAARALNSVTDAADTAAHTVRNTATAAELGDIAGAVGSARAAAVEDVGGPNLLNWIKSRFSAAWDKVTGHKTLNDVFDATEAAGTTYESRVFNQHLFGGRQKSAPTFNDIREAFEQLTAADTKSYVNFDGLTMQQIRANKNSADMAVKAGTASDNTDWVKQAREMYDQALKESYGNVADNFYKTVVNHVAGQLKTATQYTSFDDLLSSLNDDVKILTTTFGKNGSFGILGDTLEITARELKNTAFTAAFEATAKAGNFGEALKNSDKLAEAVNVIKQALGGKMDFADAAKAFEQLTGDTKAFNEVLNTITEINDVRSGVKTLEEISSSTKTFIDSINDFGSQVVVMRSTAADVADTANDLLFSGKQAAQAVNAAADTVSNSFKSLLSRAVDGVANFGLIDIAIAGVTAAIQHSVDEANKASLQASMAIRDETGSVATLAASGYNIGNVIGNDIYHGAAQEFGNAIASGVVSSLGATAGFALGGKVGDVIGTALGTAVAGPLGAIVGKIIGTGVGLAAGAVTGMVADGIIDSMGGHSTTNLYLDDYLNALRDGSLITADALDEMCAAVGVTADEIAELGQTAALAKHGVDVEALEELARNINTNVTMGSADYSKFFEKDDINRVLTGNANRVDYTQEQVAARIAAALGAFDGSLFSRQTISYTDDSAITDTKMVSATATIVSSKDLEAVNEALKELQKYTDKELSIRQLITSDGVTVNTVVDENGQLANFNFAELEGVTEVLRLMYTQGNTTSDLAQIFSEVLAENKELRAQVAESLEGGYSRMAAYNNLGGYLDLYNSSAGTNYTLDDLSSDWELGTRIQSFASQYNELGVDELQKHVAQLANNSALYDVNTGKLNTGLQTIWGADLSSLLPGHLEEFSKLGINLSAGSVMGETVLSAPQEYKYADLSIDTEVLKEAITGWRIDVSDVQFPNELDFSNMTITTKDAEILASAGIQINSDGTITFMKAEQANVSGSARQSDTLDPGVFSEYVLDVLKQQSFVLNFEAGELNFDPKEVGSNIYGAMFKLPSNFSTKAQPEVEAAMEQIGHMMESGYFMITDQAILNGEMSIEAFVDGLVSGSGKTKLNSDVAEALGNIDALIQQEGNTAVENITEWASAITIPSPFSPDEINESMEAMFASMGIHFVEYGDEFLMQINQTGEHIKDGCVMIDAEYWAGLTDGLPEALKLLDVEVTEVGNQVMIDLSETMENGIGKIVSLYTERPDLWDQLPEAVKTALSACINETDNGMLELSNLQSSRLVQIGEDWVLGWQSIGEDTMVIVRQNNENVVTSLDTLISDIDNGMARITNVITEEDLDTLTENEIAIPFRELPPDIQQSLTGPGGLSSAMEEGLVVVKTVEAEQLAEIVSGAQVAAADVGAAGADIVAQIKQAVTEANIELNRLQTMQSMAGKSGGVLGFGATANQVGNAYQGYIKNSDGSYSSETTIYPIYNSSGDKIIKWGYYDENGVAHTTTITPQKRASGGPAAGLTLTGELGTEMAILPDGSIKMLGANGRGELVDLPAGTRVLNAEDTEEVLKYTGPITSVPKLAEGNTDLVIQQPEQNEDQTFKALMMTFMRSMIGQQTTNDAATDLAITTDPMITVVDDAAKNLKEGNEVAIHGAVATIQETMALYGTQELTTLDNGFNNIIAALSEQDDAWSAQFKAFEENLGQLFSALTTTINDGFDQMSADHSSMTDDIIEAIQNARDEIVQAIKSISISVGGTSSTSASSSAAGGYYSSSYGTSGYTDSSVFVTDGVGVFEVSSSRASQLVKDSEGNIDWSATAVAFAALGDWAGAVEAMNNRLEKIAAIGTDYGVSNDEVYNKALEAYNNRVVGFSDYTENVRGYLSVGSVQNALNEFDKRGYKISVTGDDGGLSQEALWNEQLRAYTGISYMQWMSLHQPGTYSAYPDYDPSEVLDVFDSDAPVITEAMDRNLKEVAQTILNGDDVRLDNFMDFCDLMARTGYANVDKNALEQIAAGHEDTVAITDAIDLLKDAFSNRISGVTGTLEYLATTGMQGNYDSNGWNYKTSEGDMYGGGWSGTGLVVDLDTDYHALMNQYAAAGNWSAFDEAAAKRDAKIQYEGTGGTVDSTSSIASDLEEKYKRNGSARGSLISEEGLYYAGEEGKQEAIIPLEQPDVLDKLGNAIGPYVDGSNVFDYHEAIDDASSYIKEGNEVAIHGAVAALLEGQGASNQTLIDQSVTNKEEIVAAITANTDAIVAALGSLATKISSMQTMAAAAATTSTGSSGSSSSGGYSSSSRPTSYTPTVTTPVTQNIYYSASTDYHALMQQYAEAGNWSAFDTAAAQRDAKMAADSSLSKWEATDTLRDQLESLYKRNGSANGSIISEEGLYYAAEENRQEAIIPLEDPQALDKVGQAIGQYTNFQRAYIDYTGNIEDASKVVKEGNEVAIHGAVAALLEGWTNNNDALFTLLTSHKDEIIAAINGVGTTISGSLSSMVTSLQSAMAASAAASAAPTSSSSSGSSGGYSSSSRPTSYTPAVTTPVTQNIYFSASTDYHALMQQYAEAGNWSAFDTAAAQRDAKMAADSSLSKWEATDTLRTQLEDLYKRNGSANGSIISEEGLYYAAEKNRQEAIIPLEDPQALNKVGEAIGQYTDFQQAYVDYTGNIDDASKVIKEGNEVAIHGAVAAILEGLTGSNDTLITLITSCKDEIIAAINGVGATITGSLSSLVSSMQSAMAAASAAASATPTSSGSSSSSGGYSSYSSYSRPTSYTPTVTTPTTNTYFSSSTDYHALMQQYAAAGNWSAFDDAANARDAKMAADSSLSVYRTTDDVRSELEEQYKRNGSAMGSLISSPGLYYAGEMGLDEAIVPLEQPQVLRKVGASIASFMPVDMQQQMSMAQGLENGGIGNATTYAPQPATDPGFMAQAMVQSVLESVLPQIANTQAEGMEEDKRPLYVGTLIADDRGLKQLERKLYDIRQVEAGRR